VTTALRRSLLLLVAAAAVGAAESAPRLKSPLGSDRAKIPAALLPAIDAAGADARAAALAPLRSRIAAAARPDLVAVRLVGDPSDGLLAAVAATGAAITRSSARWRTIEIEATPAQVDEVSRLAGVELIRLQQRPLMRQQGIADNHADIDMHTDQVRASTGATGASRRIGVISDTVNRTGAVGAGAVSGVAPNATLTGTTPQGTGDLPSSIRVVDFGPSTGTDEGEAMLELVHDIAPGSPLAFASASTSQLAFATNVTRLRTLAGCDVVVDDVGFPDEPVFQDGPIAQAIDGVRGNGALYFSAAGNEGGLGILMPYVDVDPAHSEAPTSGTPTGVDFHDWGIGGATPSFLPIDVPGGGTVRAILEWSQPYHSFGLGPGAQTDLDLYLYSAASASSTILAVSGDPQGTAGAPAGDPWEGLDYTNTGGATQRVYLAIDHYQGLPAVTMNVILFGNVTSPATSVFTGPSILGHPSARGCVAVGAIFYGDIANPAAPSPFGGGDPNATNPEPFTSRGGVGPNAMRIWFDGGGRAFGTPQRRNKPDLAAPDGVNTSVFGSDIAFDADALPNFFGTSCAAPNAAAAAALLWDALPGHSADDILSRLTATATDIVSSSPSATPNLDDRTGWGLVNAEAALAYVPDPGASPKCGFGAGIGLVGMLALALARRRRQRSG
jgi:MYXO-CTERM domain-containing protein